MDGRAQPEPVTWDIADMNGTARKIRPGTRVATVTGTVTASDGGVYDVNLSI